MHWPVDFNRTPERRKVKIEFQRSDDLTVAPRERHPQWTYHLLEHLLSQILFALEFGPAHYRAKMMSTPSNNALLLQKGTPTVLAHDRLPEALEEVVTHFGAEEVFFALQHTSRARDNDSALTTC